MTFYHYTDERGLNGILASQLLLPSLTKNNPNDVRYGEGQYLSDVVPGSKSSAQLSRLFVNNPFQGAKYTHFVEIMVDDLRVVKGRQNVYIVMNTEPLPLKDRVVRSGSLLV